MNEKVNYPGAQDSVFIEKMDFIHSYPIIPTYRVLSTDGDIIDSSQNPNVSQLT